MPVPETREDDHPERSKRNYLLNADGSGTGATDNPAQGAIGVVLSDPDGHLIAEISKRIGPAINTVAECRALIEGLKLARSRGSWVPRKWNAEVDALATKALLGR
jgi:hypothetical protein